MKRRKGFTIVEILVVVGIIMVLAALLLPTLGYARRKARVTQCMNNLKQVHDALLLYQQDHIGQGGYEYFPYRLTYLNRDGYTRGGEKLFLCPLDSSKGAEGGKPSSSASQFTELDEGGGLGEVPLSYMYEFSGATCSWPWGTYITVPNYDRFYLEHPDGTGASWGEVKQAQLKYGDTSLNPGLTFGWDPKTVPAGTVMKGYPASRFPALRCFWHMAKPDDASEEEVMNLSYMGNVFKSVPQWEFSAHQ